MGCTKGKQMEGGDPQTPEDHVVLRPAKDSVDKLNIILEEIKDSRQAIENRLSSITIELNILKDDQAKLSERTSTRSLILLKSSHRITHTKLPLQNCNSKWKFSKKGLRTRKGAHATIISAFLDLRRAQKEETQHVM
ncbi:hypothetical protein NDU88_003702 [Pleurodeles waltl]|uniref:Uncharacterized protein n=1 Tax=Pleurodeles waltl TaxID=8319 RepID=A0AAV7TPR3_PLEWA|nr:hypothetical protein NDU88_003702 [Pleurodeles waltl]